MTPPAPARTHIWDGTHTLPDWLTNHHWTAGQLVIRTPDGDTRPRPGWWLIGWTDGSVTAATPTVAERVYGPDGIASRLAHAETEAARLRADIAACQAQQWPQRLAAAETALARIQAVADDHPAGIDTALIHEALDQPGPATAQATEPVAWTPPPPGSTAEQLPDHLLDLIRPYLRGYTSTACQTAGYLAEAMADHPQHVPELAEWRQRMRDRCRANMKYTGELCPHHRTEKEK